MTDSTYQVKQIDDKSHWEKWIDSRPEANFLQSWNWGQFEQRLGKKTLPLAVFNGEKQVAAAMTIKEEAKRGNHFTIAGGPLLDWSKSPEAEQILKGLMTHLAHLAKKENCLFIRIRPQVEESDELTAMVEDLGFQLAPMHLTADLTLQLDLEQSEDELLAQMRKNTRYYIRRAKRDGVITKTSQEPKLIKRFHKWQLYLADLHDFVPFSYDFLRHQFEVFAADDQAMIISSYHDEELLASAFVIFYNQEAVYHYGISTPKGRDFPGSYATQWAAIKEAKKRGCKVYNFWGIAPDDQPDHRFAGVSLFKKGFGGREVQYLPAHDYPVSPLYMATKGFEMIRKKVRGL